MSELAIREPDAIAVRQPDHIIQRSGGIWERDIIDGWIQVLDDVSRLANFIAETDFVPRALRNRPAAVAACILTGRELGVGPMQSLKVIHMIQGVPSLSAEYKRARALAAGHDIAIDETNTTRCVIRGRRAGSERWVTIRWDLDMARKAKLAGKDVWQQYPQRMLQARASGELCDLLFPDASLGLATMEVLEDGAIVDAATGEVTSDAGDKPAIEAPKPNTAQRKPRTRTAQPAQAATPPAVSASPVADAGGALPPLPGEDEETPTGAVPAAASDSTGARAAGATAQPDDTDYDTFGTVTPKQLTKIWTTLTGEFGFKHDAKDDARSVCAHIAGHDLASSKDLTHNEAHAVIETLSHWKAQADSRGEHPYDYMIGLMAAQDAGGRRGAR